MYGESKYSQLNYGEREMRYEAGVDDCTADLSKHLPQNHRGKNVVKLLDVTGDEICILDYYIDESRKQAHVDDATFGLGSWEEMLNIDTNRQATYEDRREIIKARLRGHGTVTKEMLRNTAESFSGGEVRIIERPSEYKFIVQFIGVKGIPRNMQSFIEMLDTIKPAHLTYEFKYTYTVWDMIDSTWDGISNRTWNDMKVYEGVIE